jgi:DNA-directed RNA polymerase subunit M/transcription elongation factor TFIIS
MHGRNSVVIPFKKNRPMIDNSPPPLPGGVQMTCPRCGSPEVEYLRRLRRLVYRMTSAWFRCERCGYLFAQSPPARLKGSKD